MASHRILLLHESLGDVAIDISTDEALEKVALAIVNHRLAANIYPNPDEPTKPEWTTDQARKHSAPQSIRAYVSSLWSHYREEYKRYEAYASHRLTAQHVVTTGDGKAALIFLETRRHFDGESFDLLEIQTTY